jgi:NADPH:quinone reductase-like Zn-dependent oxidoreductase
LSPFVAQRLTTFISTEHHSHIERLAGHLASGAVVPSIHARFPLERAAEAIRQMESGRASAKTAIIVQ